MVHSILYVAILCQCFNSHTRGCTQTVPLLFTENETNTARLFGTPNPSPYVKDGIDNAIVHGQQDAVNPCASGH